MACVFALGCLAASPARAQRQTGPFAGLFGGDAGQERVQALDARVSVFGAYDNNLPNLADSSAPIDPRFQGSGLAGGVTAGLDYARRARRARVALGAASSFREYAAVPDLSAAAYSTSAELSVNLGPKAAFDAKSGYSYAPFYAFAPLHEAGPPTSGAIAPAYRYATTAERTDALNGSIALTSNYSKRSSVSIDAGWFSRRFFDDPSEDVQVWSGHAVLRRRLTRALAMRLGYGREEARFGALATRPLVNHLIDVGLDGGDGLASSRRTLFSISTGNTVITSSDRTRYRLNGAANLARGFARTWSASIGYTRGTEFVAGFAVPLLSDSVGVGLGGLVAPRLHWTAGAAFSRGLIGFVGANDFTVYSGTTRIEVAVARRVAVFGQYTYYRYDVPSGSTVLQSAPRLARQAGTVGLAVWVPIINEARLRRDSR